MTSKSSSLPDNSFNLEQAHKQFTLETERLEMTYGRLEERFKAVQTTIQESHTRLSGKLAELDFVSRYLETILNHISQGILFIDLNGIVTTYNATAQQILRIPEKKLLFHSFIDFFEEHFLGFSLQQAFESKQCPRRTFITWNDHGMITELEVEPTFVTMGQQTYPLDYRHQHSSPPIQGLLILLRDITKLRYLQQAANQHDRLKELGELASHMAHEVRNPLGGIKGFANLLHQELRERPDLQQMVSHIAQGADDLNLFVSHILQYARPFQLHIENIDLLTLMEEIREFLHADPVWKPNIQFHLSSTISPLIVPIDPQLFKSALLNLFVNAIQAMPEGGDLTVRIEIDSSWVTICIQDTGIGIPSENIPKIFSPFFTTKETGTGLGLAEVQKVIQAHQGWIEVHSEMDKGTEFTIKVPLKPGV